MRDNMANLAKELQPRKWRTQEMQDKYQEERKNSVANDTCPLCLEKSLMEFDHWRVIPNKYPYDAVALQHTMIIPKEHLQEHELSQAALRELGELKAGALNQKYLYIMEALPSTKSIPGHFHLHLINPKVVD